MIKGNIVLLLMWACIWHKRIGLDNGMLIGNWKVFLSDTIALDNRTQLTTFSYYIPSRAFEGFRDRS